MLLLQNGGQALHQKWLHFRTIEMILTSAPSRAWRQPAGWQAKTRVYAIWLYARARSGPVEGEVTFRCSGSLTPHNHTTIFTQPPLASPLPLHLHEFSSSLSEIATDSSVLTLAAWPL